MTRRAPLPPAFFDRPVLEVAPDLLGAVVTHCGPAGPVSARLTEVEAYDGETDPGSHAFRGRTPRNAVMFGPPGRVYVYFTYGMHWCMNLVCGPVGTASAVLLRAGEVVEGRELALARRTTSRSPHDLARGPARLTQALRIGPADLGVDLLSPASSVRLHRGEPLASVSAGPRVGISLATDLEWRFWDAESPSVSVFRPGGRPRRRTAGQDGLP